MTKKPTPIISIRVTEEEKDKIKELADLGGLTITDYIKQKALYDVVEDNSNTSNTKDLQRKTDALRADIQRLEAIIEGKSETIDRQDKEVSRLEDQLEQANKRIDDYSRQLEQQQSLQLATVTTNKELQLKLDTLEEAQKDDKQRKGFFSRLFSGN